jgi:hypothetical protein
LELRCCGALFFDQTETSRSSDFDFKGAENAEFDEDFKMD